MRLLLDHNLDRRLAAELALHDVRTARAEHWDGLADVQLLRRAEREFDVLLTADRSLVRQNHIPSFDLAVILLRPRTNRLAELLPLVPRILAALETIRPGEALTITPAED